jgi:hypothetical protein
MGKVLECKEQVLHPMRSTPPPKKRQAFRVRSPLLFLWATPDRDMNFQFTLRAGLTLGLLRSAWVAVEHFTGIRTTHLELVEPSYGLYLFLGAPLAWLYLLRSNRFNRPSLSLKGLLPAAVGAGAVAGAVNVLTFWLYTDLLNPEYLDAFIQWNVSESSNTFDIANREFRLPAFLDILVMHPLLLNPATAGLVSLALRSRDK